VETKNKMSKSNKRNITKSEPDRKTKHLVSDGETAFDLNAWLSRRESEYKRQVIYRYGHEDYPAIRNMCLRITSDLELAKALARAEGLIDTGPERRNYFIRQLISDLEAKTDQRKGRHPGGAILQKQNEYVAKVVKWLEDQSKRSGKRKARIPPLDDILVRRNAEWIRESLEENGFMSGKYFTGKKLHREERRAPARQFLYLCYYLCTRGFIKDNFAWEESTDRKVIIGAMTSRFLKKPFSDRSMRNVGEIRPKSAYTTFYFLGTLGS